MRLWIREIIRACIAFALYVALPLLPWSDRIGSAYWSLIAKATRPILEWTRHFKGIPGIQEGIPDNQHSHLLLILSLFAVSWRIPLARRLRYFTILAAFALLQDGVAALLSLKLHEAKLLFQQRGWVLLLPWEYGTIQVVWYLLYAIPLHAVPFLLFLITALWNSGIHPKDLILRLPLEDGESQACPPERSTRTRLGLTTWVAVAGSSVLLLVAAIVGNRIWTDAREHDLLHQRTHVLLGNARLLEGKIPEAEAEYRQAVTCGIVDAEAWVRLARIEVMRGNRAEALAVLRQGAGVVQDSVWREQIQADLEALGSTDPYRIPSIVATAPTSP